MHTQSYCILWEVLCSTIDHANTRMSFTGMRPDVIAHLMELVNYTYYIILYTCVQAIS